MSSVNSSSRNELTQDYLNMKVEDGERKSDPLLHYDNVGHIRPVDASKKAPIEPMEVVPMIQLDNYEDNSGDQCGQSYDQKSWSTINPSNHSSNNYLNMDSNFDCLLSGSEGKCQPTDIRPEVCFPPPYSHVI